MDSDGVRRLMEVSYLPYRKRGVTWMRPWTSAEDMTGVSVSEVDTPGIGGFIAVNPDNPRDRWYVAASYAALYYEPYTDSASEIDKLAHELADERAEVEQLRNVISLITVNRGGRRCYVTANGVAQEMPQNLEKRVREVMDGR